MLRPFGAALSAILIAATLIGLSAGHALADHVQCGDVVTQDTTLDSDLMECPREGIVIAADDVTLDLNGHTVDGTGWSHPTDDCQVGIVSGSNFGCPRATEPGYDGVVVRGGTIRDFAFGVRLIGTENSEVSEVAVSGAFGGIALDESRHSVVTRTRPSDNEFGILLNDVANIVVSHNAARGNRNGIGGEAIEQGRLEKNLLTDNQQGMIVHSIRDSFVSHNRALRNGVGLEASDGVFDSLVTDNRMMDNDNGIVVFEGTGGNRVERNQVLGNAGAPTFIGDRGVGILVDKETHVEGNTVSANGTGVLLCCIGRNTVVRNRITRNGEGVRVIGELDRNRIDSNNISRNAKGGIVVQPGIHWNGGEVIEGNRVSRNGGDGIFLGPGPKDAADSVISGNLTTRNEDDGIDVDSDAALLERNRATWNGDLGIEAVSGVIDGGLNRAFGNDNPLQCVNVTCSRNRRAPG